jgi:phosphoribosyl 1,2-cyclic phosphate phosphodiesterase
MLGSGTSAGVPMIGCHCAVCTSTDPRDNRTRPSIVVHYAGHNVLVDTTPELRLQAVRERLDRLSAVVYTHAHADHIFGLDDVRRYNTLMKAPLPLYAAPDVMAILRNAFPYAFVPPPAPPAPPPGVAAIPYKDAMFRPELAPAEISGPFELFGRTWTPIELVHGRFRVLGFRVGNFAYCTDCNEIPMASRELLKDLDVLILDALRPRPHPTHLSFEQALEVVAELKPKRTYFTHLSHDMKHADIDAWLPPHVRVGYDGLKIDLV